MKLSICLIGEDSLALASLKQQLDKDAAFYVEPRVYSYGNAFDGLRNNRNIDAIETKVHPINEAPFACQPPRIQK